MIVQRGFPQPPSFHSDRLRVAPVGHYFEVITNGYGVMYPFGSRITPADRWAIIAYIRALQFSQHATSTQLEPSDRDQLGNAK
jgi:mono/diheme cytochrome c family protein